MGFCVDSVLGWFWTQKSPGDKTGALLTTIENDLKGVKGGSKETVDARARSREARTVREPPWTGNVDETRWSRRNLEKGREPEAGSRSSDPPTPPQPL